MFDNGFVVLVFDLKVTDVVREPSALALKLWTLDEKCYRPRNTQWRNRILVPLVGKDDLSEL